MEKYNAIPVRAAYTMDQKDRNLVKVHGSGSMAPIRHASRGASPRTDSPGRSVSPSVVQAASSAPVRRRASPASLGARGRASRTSPAPPTARGPADLAAAAVHAGSRFTMSASVPLPDRSSGDSRGTHFAHQYGGLASVSGSSTSRSDVMRPQAAMAGAADVSGLWNQSASAPTMWRPGVVAGQPQSSTASATRSTLFEQGTNLSVATGLHARFTPATHGVSTGGSTEGSAHASRRSGSFDGVSTSGSLGVANGGAWGMRFDHVDARATGSGRVNASPMLASTASPAAKFPTEPVWVPADDLEHGSRSSAGASPSHVYVGQPVGQVPRSYAGSARSAHPPIPAATGAHITPPTMNAPAATTSTTSNLESSGQPAPAGGQFVPPVPPTVVAGVGGDDSAADVTPGMWQAVIDGLMKQFGVDQQQAQTFLAQAWVEAGAKVAAPPSHTHAPASSTPGQASRGAEPGTSASEAVVMAKQAQLRAAAAAEAAEAIEGRVSEDTGDRSRSPRAPRRKKTGKSSGGAVKSGSHRRKHKTEPSKRHRRTKSGGETSTVDLDALVALASTGSRAPDPGIVDAGSKNVTELLPTTGQDDHDIDDEVSQVWQEDTGEVPAGTGSIDGAAFAKPTHVARSAGRETASTARSLEGGARAPDDKMFSSKHQKGKKASRKKGTKAGRAERSSKHGTGKESHSRAGSKLRAKAGSRKSRRRETDRVEQYKLMQQEARKLRGGDVSDQVGTLLFSKEATGDGVTVASDGPIDATDLSGDAAALLTGVIGATTSDDIVVAHAPPQSSRGEDQHLTDSAAADAKLRRSRGHESSASDEYSRGGADRTSEKHGSDKERPQRSASSSRSRSPAYVRRTGQVVLDQVMEESNEDVSGEERLGRADRERERTRDRDNHRSRHHRSRDSHHGRDRERDRDRDRDRDRTHSRDRDRRAREHRDRSREYSRERDRSADQHRRSSRERQRRHRHHRDSSHHRHRDSDSYHRHRGEDKHRDERRSSRRRRSLISENSSAFTRSTRSHRRDRRERDSGKRRSSRRDHYDERRSSGYGMTEETLESISVASSRYKYKRRARRGSDTTSLSSFTADPIRRIIEENASASRAMSPDRSKSSALGSPKSAFTATSASVFTDDDVSTTGST